MSNGNSQDGIEIAGKVARQRWEMRSRRGLWIPAVIFVTYLVVFVWAGFGAAIADDWYSMINWTRTKENAGAVQAITTVAQAVFAVTLVLLTFWQARSALLAAREERAYTVANTQPVVTFASAELTGTSVETVRVCLVNNGLGVAFGVFPFVRVGRMPYQIAELGASNTNLG